MKRFVFSVILLLTLVLMVSCAPEALSITLMNENDTIYDKVATDHEAVKDITLPTPEKTGYDFIGWYTDRELKSSFDVATVDKSVDNVTLFPKFTAKEYTLTVKYSDAEHKSTLLFGEELRIALIDVPDKLFCGLYSDENYTVPFESPSTMPANDITVYAKWVDSLQVKVSASIDGALTVTGGELTQTLTRADSDFDALTVSANYGYGYLGYKIGEEIYTGTTVDLENVTADTEILLLCEYSAKAVTLMVGTDVYGTRSVSTDKISQFIAPAATKTGHTFLGWFADEECTTPFTTDMLSRASAPITLYADFTTNTYTLKVHTGISVTSVGIKYGEDINYTPIDRSDMIYVGLYADEDFTTPYTLGAAMPDSTVHVYEKWVDKYTVTVSVNIPEAASITGGALVQNITRAHRAFDTLTIGTKYGYSYLGYEIDGQRYTGTTLELGEVDRDVEVTVLYEHGVKAVTLMNGAEVYGTRSVNTEEMDAFTLPNDLSKKGYTFLGWFTDEECETVFTLNALKTANGPLTLYAGFRVNSYELKVHTGAEVNTLNIPYGSAITYERADRADLIFCGLYADEDFTTPYTLGAAMPDSTVHVYEKWVESFTVTVKVNMPNALTLSGGALTQTITRANPEFTPITAEANYGYKYVGYEINGQSYTGSTVEIESVNTDIEITFIAQYATYELPIINIDTNGVPIVNKYDYVDMTFSMTNTDGELEDVTGGVRYRGNSTYSFSKKPYRIKFDKKQSLFGLEKAKSWVLLADYLDPTGLKNHAAYSIADEAGFRFVASPHKVNLYLNGEYMGLFTLCEQMQENEGRIDIEKDITEDMTDLFDFNFFISMDRKVLEDAEAVEGESYFYLEEYEQYIELKYPEKSDFVSEEQFQSFFSQLQDYMSSIFYIFTNKDAEAIKAACNVDSLVNFAIIDQIMGENDHRSCSFNMFYTTTSDNPAENGKLNFGPIWDYDFSLHVAWTREPDVLFQLSNKETYTNVFLQAVRDIREFQQLRNEKWHSYFAPRLTEYLSEYDALVDSMKESLELNAAKWYTNPEKHPEGLLENSIAHLKAFLAHRLELFNEKWALE